jgi:hypothetical protein
MRMMLRNLVLAGLTLILTGATGPTWEHWQTIPGIFDVAGPRQDGSLVVAGSGLLYLVDPSGNVSPFARGPQGYAGEGGGAESYLTVSPGLPMTAAGCNFAPDDVFVLRLHAPPGITRIDGQGHATPFATVAGVESLGGIAFDTTGAFGFRLLVSGGSKGKTSIAAIDCKGSMAFITQTAPTVEGGLAVAPAGFGPYGGDLMAPDEGSGKIYAIAPDGTVAVAAVSGLPVGGDIGVESVAFVPQGFSRGGAAYYSDRLTPGNPHPGTDSLLRLTSPYLTGAAVHDGDLLGATEGGATMVDVRCDVTCQVFTVVGVASTSHGEGHIAFTTSPILVTSPLPSTTPLPTVQRGMSVPFGAILLSLVGLALAIALVARRLSRGRS